MKLVYKTGNLLDVQMGHIVHGCNACGVMGSGVALAVKKTYPEAFNSYRAQYESVDGLELGQAYPYAVNQHLVLWNAITQQGFGQPTRNCSYDAIQTCFEYISSSMLLLNEVPAELHIPLIGAGLGGGNWNIIANIIEETVPWPTTVWLIDGKMPEKQPIKYFA
jgi:O-acetyl-ADP-ribose deacetylase (regulator of RNase III)